MNERVALVTGAARGIGAETVRRLVLDGYRVVALDSCSADQVPNGVRYRLADRADLDSLVNESPDAVLPFIADVRDRDALNDAAQLAVDRFGRLDATVAAAAVIAGGSALWDTPSEELHTLLEVDVVGVWNTAAASIPHMLKNPEPSGCRFVAVASAAGEHGMFRLAGYNVAKHAVIGLVRGLAADLIGTGVTAVAVSPGSTDTHMLAATADIYDLADSTEFAHSSPLRRLLDTSEIASVITFCCSKPGAPLNGSVVSASGGFPH